MNIEQREWLNSYLYDCGVEGGFYREDLMDAMTTNTQRFVDELVKAGILVNINDPEQSTYRIPKPKRAKSEIAEEIVSMLGEKERFGDEDRWEAFDLATHEIAALRLEYLDAV